MVVTLVIDYCPICGATPEMNYTGYSYQVSCEEGCPEIIEAKTQPELVNLWNEYAQTKRDEQ